MLRCMFRCEVMASSSDTAVCHKFTALRLERHAAAPSVKANLVRHDPWLKPNIACCSQLSLFQLLGSPTMNRIPSAYHICTG